MSEEIEYQETFTFEVTDYFDRIDKYLVNKLEGFSRSKIQGLIADKHILVNNKSVKANYIVEENDVIEVSIPEPEEIDIEPENIPVDIIYEDKDIVLVNKPQGMVVHPAKGHQSGTLVNALLYHIKDLSGINGKIRPGNVHRLDKDTSGILIVAKNDKAHTHLSEQIQNRTMDRNYLALVHGTPPHETGTIDAPIGRNPKDRIKFTVIKTGKEAITHFRVSERFKEYSLLEVSLETGRTHQIRVHLDYINYPVAGDEVYGPAKTLKGEGQFLHAQSLGFIHPRTGEEMYFEAELPEIFEKTLNELRQKD